MKIRYRRFNGYTSTAYMDDDDTIPGRLIYAGEDKYTGARVTVQWDASSGEWKELTDA